MHLVQHEVRVGLDQRLAGGPMHAQRLVRLVGVTASAPYGGEDGLGPATRFKGGRQMYQRAEHHGVERRRG